MDTPKWSESDFALDALSGLGLLDPTKRIKKVDLAKDRIIPILTSDHNVKEPSQAEVSAKGVAKTQAPELFLDLSPKYWRPDDEGGSQEERDGMTALSDLLWGEMSVSGTVQSNLSGRYVLCRARVQRTVHHPTGGPSPMNVPVGFVTENAQVANIYYVTPQTGTLVTKAESLTKQLDLVNERMPENATNVAELLSPAVQAAVAKLSQITMRAGLKLTVTADGKLALANPTTEKKVS